jgi:hypothetical protein
LSCFLPVVLLAGVNGLVSVIDAVCPKQRRRR